MHILRNSELYILLPDMLSIRNSCVGSGNWSTKVLMWAEEGAVLYVWNSWSLGKLWTHRQPSSLFRLRAWRSRDRRIILLSGDKLIADTVSSKAWWNVDVTAGMQLNSLVFNTKCYSDFFVKCGVFAFCFLFLAAVVLGLSTVNTGTKMRLGGCRKGCAQNRIK